MGRCRLRGSNILTVMALHQIYCFLIPQVSDIGAGPVTITWAAEQVVDFSKPFMSLGSKIHKYFQ